LQLQTLTSDALLSAASLALTPASTLPLYRQLYRALRARILAGELAGGARLPATRTLAAELGVSRNTVAGAYAQLLAEGYVEGQVGAGTYVSRVLPDRLLRARRRPAPVSPPPSAARGLSARGARIAATEANVPRLVQGLRPFRTGLPAVDAFPFALWARLAARRYRQPGAELAGYGEAAGYRPLREAIAAYLGASRGVRCTPDQVIIVGGSQQALDLATRLLLDEGDRAWVEDPGYPGARGALAAAGAQLVPVPVDAEGIDLAVGERAGPPPRAVYITPSHQFPLGVTMSLARRLALLEWAGRAGVWVIEDDYDSEYRYRGRPLAALQGLDTAGRVIYTGTFSKVLFPSLRLGYLVAPPDLVDAFVAARAVTDRHSRSLDQAVLADFINEGHFAHHLRRMRRVYAERQSVLVAEARRHLAGLLDVAPTESGMHLIGWLPAGQDDRAAARRAAAHDIDAQPLSAYAGRRLPRGGLLLGFTAVGEAELREGVRDLANALGELKQGDPSPSATARDAMMPSF
jgi:GntR family transcriptional regulator/MocR family aminotransferase